jgi:hypothetical protein
MTNTEIAPFNLLHAHHEVSTIQDGIISDDAPSQEDVIQGILRAGVIDPNADAHFYDEAVNEVTLSRLEAIYKNGRKEQSMRMLLNRNKICITDGDTISHNNPFLFWGIHKHYLDFLLVVPKNMGLDAVIPNRIADHNFGFQMTLKHPNRAWLAKNGKLGFAPKGRMLYVGTASGQQVWLAMAPLEFFGEACPLRLYQGDKETTRDVMPTGRYRRCVIMLASMLQAISFTNIQLNENYPGRIDSKLWTVSTNIL